MYERGVNLFKFPHSREIWQAYLKQFVERFGAKKLERARDLFEQCCAAAPPKDCKPFFLEYARLEAGMPTLDPRPSTLDPRDLTPTYLHPPTLDACLEPPLTATNV